MIDQSAYVQQALELTAEQRSKLNQTSPVWEESRIKAQFAFGLASGIMPNFASAVRGDTEFLINIRYSVGVMNTIGDGDLRVPEKEANHDIYVLYDISEDFPVARPLGWCWGALLRTMDVDAGEYVCPASALKPMDSLVKMMRKGGSR